MHSIRLFLDGLFMLSFSKIKPQYLQNLTVELSRRSVARDLPLFVTCGDS